MDGRTAAALAYQLSGPEAGEHDRLRSVHLAEAALGKEPAALRAVVALGVNALYQGNVELARRMFQYSQKLSRRDLQTQLWAIEDAVSRNDIRGALKHYDTALRTSRHAPDILFPVLSGALDEPEVRAEVARTLSKRPIWFVNFIEHVAANGPPSPTSALFLDLRRNRMGLPPGADAAIVDRLLRDGNVEEAWSYFSAIRGANNRQLSRNPDFSADIDSPTFFDWMPVNDSGVTTSIEHTRSTSGFFYSVATSSSGTLLQQVQLLPSGFYTLEGRATSINEPDNTRPYWIVNCRDDGRELVRVSLPGGEVDVSSFRARFFVPEGCTIQTLSLIARPSDSIGGLSGSVHLARIRPVEVSEK